MNRAERIKGAVMGHAAGDALGVPVEFMSRRILDGDPVTGMRGYGTHNQPSGTWSDDTSLMLCLLESMQNGMDLDDLARKFVAWREEAYMTAHGRVFDIGVTTSLSISRLKNGTSPIEAGEDGERSNGNGSLMRILPIAFMSNIDDEEMVLIAHDVSSLTHRHLRSQIACGLFLLLGRRLLEGMPVQAAYADSISSSLAIYGREPFNNELSHFSRYLAGDIDKRSRDDIQSSGYVVHTLEASVWCLLTSGGFREAVLKSVNLGDDSDTTGAVTGGLAGAAYGYEAIPEEWLKVVARKEEILKLTETCPYCM